MYQDPYVPIWSTAQNTQLSEKEKREREEVQKSIHSMLPLVNERRTHT